MKIFFNLGSAPRKNYIYQVHQTKNLLEVHWSGEKHLKRFCFPVFLDGGTRGIDLPFSWPMIKDQTVWVGSNNVSDEIVCEHWFPFPIHSKCICFLFRKSILKCIVEGINTLKNFLPQLCKIKLVKFHLLHLQKKNIKANFTFLFLDFISCRPL